MYYCDKHEIWTDNKVLAILHLIVRAAISRGKGFLLLTVTNREKKLRQTETDVEKGENLKRARDRKFIRLRPEVSFEISSNFD